MAQEAGESTGATDFPLDPAEFPNDDRISFSKVDGKYMLETENGAEFMFDTALKRWVLSVDEELVRKQQEIYKIEGVDETEINTRDRKKRKHQGDGEGGDSQKPKKPRQNTAVYVTSIPLDADSEEIYQVFSKYGVIAEEIDSGRHRIKMYNDDEGNFKGEALVVYFRPESVQLAIDMLDDSEFRYGVPGPSGTMKVEAADFSYKSQQEAPTKTNMKEKRKIIERTQRLNSKLADWDDDDPAAAPIITKPTSRLDRLVILKHMFTLQELDEDPAAILDIKEDIREECGKLGEVTNVVLYDKEPEGVVSVRFTDPESAQRCVKMMDGRFFGGTRVEAYVPQEKVKFRQSGDRQDRDEMIAKYGVEGADEEEARRLEKFGDWLEAEGGKAEEV